jgi:hypothetical protein
MLIYPAVLTKKRVEQEDPLSPYLFLLCVEGFSALLNRAEQESLISCVKVCHAAPSISCLVFVDDSLILVHANREEATQLQHILDLYEWCLGRQMINRSKLAILFSTNIRTRNIDDVWEVLHIPCETTNEKYLGLPVHVGKSKTKAFAYLKD